MAAIGLDNFEFSGIEVLQEEWPQGTVQADLSGPSPPRPLAHPLTFLIAPLLSSAVLWLRPSAVLSSPTMLP